MCLLGFDKALYYLLFYFAVYIDDICKLSNFIHGITVVLYADDILLIAPSVSVLQKLLLACKKELDTIDLLI